MRDDFNNETKRILQERVGNRCSNPECRCLTSGPNYEPEKATRIGVAAHITAASAGGPRFNSSLSSEERRSISNGIWLCQNCAKLIDSDEYIYQTELIFKWKEISEENCRRELEGKPLIDYPQKDGWFCGHCRTFVEHAQTVCTGCQAEVAYSATQPEREEAMKIGLVIGGMIGFIIFFVLPNSLNSNFDLNLPIGLGLGIYAVGVSALLAMAGGFLLIEHTERKYRNKPPRFFRPTRI